MRLACTAGLIVLPTWQVQPFLLSPSPLLYWQADPSACNFVPCTHHGQNGPLRGPAGPRSVALHHLADRPLAPQAQAPPPPPLGVCCAAHPGVSQDGIVGREGGRKSGQLDAEKHQPGGRRKREPGASAPRFHMAPLSSLSLSFSPHPHNPNLTCAFPLLALQRERSVQRKVAQRKVYAGVIRLSTSRRPYRGNI